MSLSKQLTCKGTLRPMFICLRPGTPFHPTYTLYTCIQYTYSYREGGGRVEPVRRGEGQQGRVQITKLGRKYQHD
jgi:hypothetical protein